MIIILWNSEIVKLEDQWVESSVSFVFVNVNVKKRWCITVIYIQTYYSRGDALQKKIGDIVQNLPMASVLGGGLTQLDSQKRNLVEAGIL